MEFWAVLAHQLPLDQPTGSQLCAPWGGGEGQTHRFRFQRELLAVTMFYITSDPPQA